jgi:hypothetical protein
MENQSAFKAHYDSMRGVGQFNWHDLRTLFTLNNPNWRANDSVHLHAVVHNLLHGRPNDPNFIDAIVAEERHDVVKQYFFRINDDLDASNRQCMYVEIQVVGEGKGLIGTFQVLLKTPEDTREWCFAGIKPNSIKVFTIAEEISIEPEFPFPVKFGTYTIFDNLSSSVDLDKVGTHMLALIETQVENYAGADFSDLFHKFRVYADCLMEQHREYECCVKYFHKTDGRVFLSVDVYKEGQVRQYFVRFGELLTKKDR